MTNLDKHEAKHHDNHHEVPKIIISKNRYSILSLFLIEESPLHRAGGWLTATKGNFKESATENKPPFGKGEKVV